MSLLVILVVAVVAVGVFAALWPDFAISHPYRGDE